MFLSHSGKDKAFVGHLDHRLRSVNHYPFFDVHEDSLPLGDKFTDIIFQASKKCQLAIVVVSDDFFMSKWPMLELASFVEAKNGDNPEMKILPLFYRLTFAQFKEPKRRRVWFTKWKMLQKSNERLDISSWKDALSGLGGQNDAMFCGTGQDEVRYIESIVQSVFMWVPPGVLYYDFEEASTSSQPPPAKRQCRYNFILSCLNVIYVVNLEFGVLLRFMVDLITI